MDDLSRPLLALPVTLVAAFLAAYGYALISGTTSCQTGSEFSFFAGGHLVYAGGLVLFSVVWLLRDYETHGRAVQGAKRVLLLITVIAAAFLLLARGDYDVASSNAGASFPDLIVIGVPLYVPIAIGTGFMLAQSVHPRFEFVMRVAVYFLRFARFRRAPIEWLHRTMTFILGVLAAGALGEVVVSFADNVAIPLPVWAAYGLVNGVALGALVAQMPTEGHKIDGDWYTAVRAAREQSS